MPVAFFQIPLSVQPKSGGEAELIPPQVVQDSNYKFVVVKEGGEEGIIQLEESDEVLNKVEADEGCKKLTLEQMKELYNSYLQPKLKQKYRLQSQTQENSETGAGGELYEVDDQGNRVVDSIQTVRSGFYLIDVPVLGQP